ncbi:MAG: HAD hydrolase-like protein [Myxococcales bacterium]
MSKLTLLFDLDGTLTDSRPGIISGIQHALGVMGLPVPPEHSLLRFIGPPTHDAFRELLSSSDPELNARAIGIYRERYAKQGLYENSVYPGVAEGLAALREAGATLFVATSKPQVFARQIIDHFGLAQYFVTVYGSELSGERSNKGDLIAHVLTQEGLTNDAWMIGDRLHDIRGAKLNGLRSAGVLWGYGSRDELSEAGADATFANMQELVEALIG